MVFNRIYTVVGARSQGKTPFIVGGDYEQGLAMQYLKKGMSILVVDELDHPKYRHFPTILPKDFKKLSFKPQLARVITKKQNMDSLFIALSDVWNTLIIFEDCYKYIGSKMTDSQMAIIGNSKNQNNCLVFMHWCWGFVQPDLFRMTNYFIIFKTSDSPEARKQYLKGCYNECIEASEKVQKIKKGKPYLIVETGI